MNSQQHSGEPKAEAYIPFSLGEGAPHDSFELGATEPNNSSQEIAAEKNTLVRAGEVFAAVKDVAEQTSDPLDNIMGDLVADADIFAQRYPNAETYEEAVTANVVGAFGLLEGGETGLTTQALAESPKQMLGDALHVINVADPSGRATKKIERALTQVEAMNQSESATILIEALNRLDKNPSHQIESIVGGTI